MQKDNKVQLDILNILMTGRMSNESTKDYLKRDKMQKQLQWRLAKFVA